MAELEREVNELRRANEILKAASAFFAAELDRPLPVIVASSTPTGTSFGVEPICAVLTEHGCRSPRAPTTPRKSRRASARAVRDAELVADIRSRTPRRTCGVYGARKIRAAAAPARASGWPGARSSG